MVAGLQHDASHIKMKLLELERAVSGRDDTFLRLAEFLVFEESWP